MFNVTPEVEQSWADADRPKATASDIAQIEGALGTRLPADYIEFVTRYGFVIFGDDDQRTCVFRYTLQGTGQRELHQHEIAFLYESPRVLKVWRNMGDTGQASGGSPPMLPPGVFPIGSDPGQGLILLELATGKVLFWRENDAPWGEGGNTRLGEVSESFATFINGLQPDPL
jgi:SMI1 / KNR4 family (SUKH-1)